MRSCSLANYVSEFYEMKYNGELTLHHPYHIDKRERKVCLEMSQVYPYPTTRFKNSSKNIYII
jgi:hypothetical protein